MSRQVTIPTQPLGQPQVLFNRSVTQKILLTLLITALVMIPLWLGLERAHSAPAKATSFPLTTAAPPPGLAPSVTLDVPDEVLIGDTFKFNVTFTPGTAVGFGPFIDLILPAGGIDYNDSSGSCDGVTYVPGSAQMVGVNGGPILVTTDLVSAPCQHTVAGACATLPHPYGANGISSVATPNILVPEGAQLVTIKLPFGSFQTNQPPIVIQVTAKLSAQADVNAPLNIYARAGFQFGSDPLNLPVPDPPATLLSPGGVTDCTTWTASAPVTPVLFTFRVEDPLTTPGPCYDGVDNGPDNLTDSKDPDCKHAKTYIGPEDETATGPNYPRQYKIILNIAAGQTVTNLTIKDCLPNNVVFTGIAPGTLPMPFPVPLAPSGPLNGNCVSFTYPNPILGTSATTDVVIVFEFYVPQLDANGQPILDPATCANALSPNDVKAEGDWIPLDPRDGPLSQHVVNDVSQQDHVLTDKRIAVQKSVETYPVPNAPLIPGGVLKYTLSFQVSDFFTVGHIVLTDSLSDGQDLIASPSAPKLTVSDRRGPIPTVVPFSPGLDILDAPNPFVNCGGVHGGRSLVFQVSTAMQNNANLFTDPVLQQGILTGGWAFTPTSPTPAAGKVEFYVVIRDKFIFPHLPGDQFVDKDDPINNCVGVSADMHTNHPTQPVPLVPQLRCTDDSKTEVRIVEGVLKKEIIAINGSTILPSPLRVAAADTITFKITMNIPSGDAEDLILHDFLPLPVLGIGTLPGQLPTAPLTLIPGPAIPLTGNINLGPLNNVPAVFTAGYTGNTADNSFTVQYQPNLNNPVNAPQWNIDIRYTVTVSNAPFADGLFLTNEVQECESNTFKETFCQTAIARFELTEPNVRIRKGVIATNNPNSVFTTFPNHLPPGKSVAALTTTGLSGGPPIWAPIVPWITSAPALINPNVFNSDLNNADANDWITFAIVLENRGSGLHGAFGVRVKDTPHPAFVTPGISWNVRGHDGRGAPFTLMPAVGLPGILALMTPAGKLLQDPGPPPILFDPGSLDHFSASSGRNLAIITYNMQLRPASQITMGQCFNNTAELISYAATAGGPNFVSSGFTPPFTDIATVCINPTLVKSVVATSEAHTTPQTSTTPQTPANTPKVAIGEIVRYRLVVRLPEGNGPNFSVTDALAPGMKFMNDNTARLAFISTGGTGITHPFPPISSPAFNVSGNQGTLTALNLNPAQTIPSAAISGGAGCGAGVTFNLGNIQNNDNDPDLEYVVIEFNALVCNVAGNQQPVNQLGTQLSNTFSVSVNGSPIATSNQINVVVVEPNLAISKVASPTTVIQGGTVNYTVNITNTGAADAFDVQFADTLPPWLTFSAGSVTVAGSCLPFAGISLAAPSVTCAKVPVNGVVTINYTAVANPPTCPTTLTNQATVRWTSLPGPQGTIVNPTGSSTPGLSGATDDGERNGVTTPLTLNDYSATALAPVTVKCPACVQAPQGMVDWWPFDETAGPVANDIALLNNVGAYGSGSAAPAQAPGVVKNGLCFDGVNDYVEVADHPEVNFIGACAAGTLTESFTIDVWVKTSASTGLQVILDKRANPGPVGYHLFLSNGRVGFQMNGLNFIEPVTGPNVADGNWHFIAVTVVRCAGAIGKLYVDGSQVLTFTPPAGSLVNTAKLQIGRRDPAFGNLYLKACIDELEIFKRALSATELQGIFAAGPSGKCKCSLESKETISCNPNGTFSYTFNLTNLTASTVTGVNFSSTGSVTITPSMIPISLPPGGSTTVTVTIGGAGAVSGATVCFFVGLVGPPPAHDCRSEHCITLPTCSIACAPRPPGMVGWWPMTMQNGAVNDVAPPPDSLVNNVGYSPAFQTVFGMVGGATGALFFGGPRVGVAPQAELDFGTGDFSIDAWVRIVTVGPVQISPIVDKFTMPGGPGFAFYVKNQRLELNVNGTTFVSTGPQMLFANPVANTGPWYFVAVTVRRSPAQATFYINGNPAGTFTAVPTTSVNNALPLWIGGTRLLPGVATGGIAIDELELFNRVLTPPQIQSIFQAGPAGKCP